MMVEGAEVALLRRSGLSPTFGRLCAWPSPTKLSRPVNRGVRRRFLETGRNLPMYDISMRPLVRLQIALAELRERESGQTTTEYAILLGFLAIAIIVALFFLRNVLRSLFSDAASSVSRAPN
jgi:Flp pilus assembly pilin Flp